MSRVKVLTQGGQEVYVPKFKMPKKPGPPSLVKKVAKLEKQVRLQKDEWKSIETYMAGSAVAAGTLYLLNGTTQGDNINQREGRQIYVQSIQSNFRAEWNSGAVTSPGTYRVILFYDKQSNGAAPAVSDLLDTSTALSCDALRNLNNRKRFKILLDRRYALTPTGASNSAIVDSFYLKKFITTQYNAGTAGTVADISSNALYLLACSDEAVNGPNNSGVIRVRFTE